MAKERRGAAASARAAAERVDASMDGASRRFDDVSWNRTQLIDIDRSAGKARWGWRNLWWWLAPLIAIPLLLIGFFWAVQHIENDIEQAAPQILRDNLPEGTDISGLTFDADYRDVTVDGVLPEGVSAAEIEQILEDNDEDADTGGDGGWFDEDEEDIRDATVVAEEPAPAALGAVDVTAESDGERIVLRGTVPSEAHKAELIAAASGTGLDVVDELTVSGLEPSSADADGQVAKMAGVIGGLAGGGWLAADLLVGDDGDVSGSIEAETADAAASLIGTSGDGVNVVAPPELGSLDVDVNYDGDRIVLNGTVFSDAERDELGDAAASVVGADNVVNNLEVSDLAPAVDDPQARVSALAATVATFGGLESADGSLNDTDLTVNGIAIDEAAQQSTTNALGAAEASGVRPGGEISIVEPEEPEFTLAEEVALLQAELDALQDEIRENVRFGTDSDGLTPAAQGTLDKVVDAMQRYSRPVVEVGGHTDSQGADDYNLRLSQERADAVAAYLTSAGIDTARIRAVGYGESQPIESNEFEEGRFTNRRVEFTAKETFE